MLTCALLYSKLWLSEHDSHCSAGLCRSYRDLVCTAAAVLLEAVAEDIREYLRSRRDTIRCIVTMLTDDSVGASAEGEGESLFEELKRTVADEVNCHSSFVSLQRYKRGLPLLQVHWEFACDILHVTNSENSGHEAETVDPAAPCRSDHLTFLTIVPCLHEVCMYQSRGQCRSGAV